MYNYDDADDEEEEGGDMDMMEGGVEVKRLILARSRLPPEEVSGRVVSGRSSALLLLVISNIIVIVISNILVIAVIV